MAAGKRVHFGVAALTLAAVQMACVADAVAQAWPARPVRIIVPYGAGGGTDVLVRLIGNKFVESTGQTFILDNRPGAAGNLASEVVAKSRPDGYTALFPSASFAINATAYKTSSFDTLKDFQPISWVLSSPLVLCVHPSVPARTVQELVALAKAKKGSLNGASAGNGALGHLSLEMFKQLTGVDVLHVPYKGGAPAINALVAGEVSLFFASALTSKPHVDSGRVRALAVTTAKRSAILPDLPTLGSIYPGFELDQWYALLYPAGVPADIVSRMNGEIVKALGAPDVRAFLEKQGVDPVGSTPDELGAYLRSEVDKYARLIKAGNIKFE